MTASENTTDAWLAFFSKLIALGSVAASGDGRFDVSAAKQPRKNHHGFALFSDASGVGERGGRAVW